MATGLALALRFRHSAPALVPPVWQKMPTIPAQVSERTKQGLEAARKRGQRLGRPPKMSKQQIREAKQMLNAGQSGVAEIAAMNGVHPWTLTRSLKRIDK